MKNQPFKIKINGEIFFKSSYSGVFHSCLAVKRDGNTYILVDTKNPSNKIILTLEEWKAFLNGIKDGEFDKI